MRNYVHGMVKGNTVVHLFDQASAGKGVSVPVERGLDPTNVKVASVTPICGSGNRGRSTGRVILTAREVTCKKCKAIVYGGKPSDY